MTAIIVTVVVLVAMLGTAAALIIPRVVKQVRNQQPWLPLPGFTDAKAAVPPGVAAVRVASALQQAAFAIAEHGPWKRDDVMRVANSARIAVIAADSWTDRWGRKVGGTTWPDGTMQVGQDLAAMCHELAHLCEMKLEGPTDDSHSSWTDRGIWAADNDYRAWLKG